MSHDPVPSLFREINDAIRELARGSDSVVALPFVCECDDLHCFETILISAEDYDAQCGLPTPLLVLDHRSA